MLADDERGPEFRRDLRRTPYVGAKTIDYITVLGGSVEHVPVDTHIKNFAKDAGVTYWNDYNRVSDLVKAAAKEYGCSTGALDAAIWGYMSTKEDPIGHATQRLRITSEPYAKTPAVGAAS